LPTSPGRSARTRLALGALALLLLGAAFGGGWFLGDRQGRAAGFGAGVRYGEVQASRKAPIPVRDRQHPAADLAATAAFRALPLTGDELDGLAVLANRSISPCPDGGKRGVSLATSLLDPAEGCAAASAQVRLALAVLRTYGGGAGASAESRAEAIEEGIAVLRVERRLPVPAASQHPPRGNPDATVTLTLLPAR
jgi:hypothetical protein